MNQHEPLARSEAERTQRTTMDQLLRGSSVSGRTSDVDLTTAVSEEDERYSNIPCTD